MANKNLFASSNVPSVPVADTVNEAGGRAYQMTDKHTLAQIAATNCFNGTYYVDGAKNLELAKNAVNALKGDPAFLAKVAVYSRDRAYMKDMPAFITTMLAGIDTKAFRRVFAKVVDNGKMLRNVIQMGRSGQCGRKFNMSAGAWRKAIQQWFDEKPSWVIFKASIGNDPSMRDILRMARPKANSPEKAALLAYLVGAEYVDGVYRQFKKNTKGEKVVSFEHSFDALPKCVRDYENYKRDKTGEVPNVDFRFLDSLGLGPAEWTEIARNAPWQMTRMNLNTFARHDVFKNNDVVNLVASRLRDKEAIQKARQFPYQLYAAWVATRGNNAIPHAISDALQDAMEISIDNVPELQGDIVVAVDCSGSMSSPVTGTREYGATSIIRCVDVAGLIASAVIRKNRSAKVYTFSNDAVEVNLNPRDTVLTNTEKLAHAGGGTNVSSVLVRLNRENAKNKVVIYVSDYESWLDGGGYYGGTAMANEWAKYKARVRDAKLVCIDLTPRNNSQINQHKDVLQVGGFGDQVFDVIDSFIKYGLATDHWVSEIEKTEV